MVLREISFDKFDEFSINHEYHSYYQSSSYALIAAENGYDYDYIGMFDDNNILVAASLILLKKIKRDISYGYAPRGFLIDYSNDLLINQFSSLIKEYYFDKGVAFIKVNPPIIVGRLKGKTFSEFRHNELNYTLENNKYLKLKNNLYFESSLPRFNGIVDLDNISFEKFKKNTRNKINKSYRKGLAIELGDIDSIPIIEKMVKKNKTFCDIDIHNYINTFGKKDSIDLFLVKVDYEQFLINARYSYEKELENNTHLNEKLSKYPTESNVTQKMNSDLILLAHKNDILEGTKCLRDDKKDYIAAAVVLKYADTVSIVLSTYDRTYSRQNANYFLYYQIMNFYKGKYRYVDLNGMTGDFTYNSNYYGLNRFKLGFNPNVYEYIGEYDLIIDNEVYGYLNETGALAKEFNKK